MTGTDSGPTGRAARSAAGASRRRHSLRLRLTATYTLIFLACGALLLAITYLLVDHATGRTLTYVSPDGKTTISVSGAEPTTPARPGRSATHGSTADTREGDNAPTPPSDRDMRALAHQQHAASMHQLLRQGGIALGVMTLLSSIIGWYVAGRMLRPLRRITATVREISASSLDQRVGMTGPRDELTELGATFDSLLDRLERSFQDQRQFVANASHELRTPLARQRTIAQVALADPEASPATLRSAHDRILAAGREQEQLIDALLDLARGEAASRRRTPTDLAELARRGLEDRATAVTERSLRTTARLSPAPVSGDPRLLERLVGNLLDNAVRHSDTGGSIEVVTHADGGSAIVVSNSGAPLTGADVETFLQPFRRGVADRTARRQGLGLGLPIVHAVARAHEASLRLEPRPDGGLRAEVGFSR